jgi:hypothetical protein
MKKLIPVGVFRELTDDPTEQKTLPSITEAISESPQEHEEKIVAYLRNGICLGARGCYVADVLDPSSKVPLNAHLYTDGTYLWTLDIAHYVEKYHLRLLSDFVAHMASMNWKAPTKEQVDVDSLDI